MTCKLAFCRLIAIFSLLFAVFIVPIQEVKAQAGGYYGGNATYQFGGQPGPFGIRDHGSVNIFRVNVAGGASANFLGCGGLGVFNFMKLQFNASNLVEKFKTIGTTMAAKFLLTTAMSIPQVAAIFDTLNAIGNMSFDIFKQSCDLSQIKRDARNNVIEQCVKSGGTRDECQTNWDSQANAPQWIKNALNGLCGYENINQSLRKPMCADPQTGEQAATCSLMAFLPQYNLNLSGSVRGGGGQGAFCNPLGGGLNNYGMRPPPFVLQSVVDGIRGVSNGHNVAASRAVETLRDSGVTYAGAMNYYGAALIKCQQEGMDDCGQGGPNAYNPQRDYVQLARVDLKSLGFGAADVTGAKDAIEADLKKLMGCPETPNPLRLLREMANQAQMDGKSMGDLTASLNSLVQTINTNQINLAGDAAATQAMGLDLQGATKLMQVAGMCAMEKQKSIDVARIIDLVYNSTPECKEAYINVAATDASQVASTYLYRTLIERAKAGKIMAATGQADSANASSTDTMAEGAEGGAPESAREAGEKTAEGWVQYFENQIKAKDEAYNNMVKTAEFMKVPNACQPSAPPQRVTIVPSAAESDDE